MFNGTKRLHKELLLFNFLVQSPFSTSTDLGTKSRVKSPVERKEPITETIKGERFFHPTVSNHFPNPFFSCPLTAQ